MSIIFSGIQPTGHLHIGNYLGAIKHFVHLQNLHECYFCVVDLHALTGASRDTIIADTAYIAIMMLAAGLDPDKCTLFVQSHVPAHAQMAWLLQCLCPLGQLERMTQFKDKSRTANRQHKENIPSGLLTYPLLMAADILLYRADIVPVGEDQFQHLELTRNMLERLQHIYPGITCLVEPQAYNAASSSRRIMSLRNAKEKMSKSAASDMTRINLMDTPQVIRQKIAQAKTDNLPVPGISPMAPQRTISHAPLPPVPGISPHEADNALDNVRHEANNLLNIYAAAKDISMTEVLEQMGGTSWKSFKDELSQALIDMLAPIQDRAHELFSNRQYVAEVLEKGRRQATAHCDPIWIDIKKQCLMCL